MKIRLARALYIVLLIVVLGLAGLVPGAALA